MLPDEFPECFFLRREHFWACGRKDVRRIRYDCRNLRAYYFRRPFRNTIWFGNLIESCRRRLYQRRIGSDDRVPYDRRQNAIFHEYHGSPNKREFIAGARRERRNQRAIYERIFLRRLGARRRGQYGGQDRRQIDIFYGHNGRADKYESFQQSICRRMPDGRFLEGIFFRRRKRRQRNYMLHDWRQDHLFVGYDRGVIVGKSIRCQGRSLVWRGWIDQGILDARVYFARGIRRETGQDHLFDGHDVVSSGIRHRRTDFWRIRIRWK